MENQIKPEIGMGATECFWSDRHACTIIAISPSGKTLTIQRDKAIRLDDNGMSDSQEYEYKPDNNGITTKATLRSNGQYRASGTNNLVKIGSRREYYDYSF